ncbi:sensor histidine kinase [Microbacterium sp.]|uniref:sensor histidine kinase n=1 Tax=Microbacterium sp. TaxID=51671 RepID=UPI0039E31692
MDAASASADRAVGTLVAASSLLLSIWWIPDALAQAGAFPAWWNAGGWGVAMGLLALAAVSASAPMAVLRGAWTVLPLALLALQFVSFAVAVDPSGDVAPWVWLLESATVCLMALRLPPAAAGLFAVSSSLSVPLSAWIFTGGVSHVVAGTTPLRLSNLVLVALVIGIRARLVRLYRAEADARARHEEQARSEADADALARFSRFVHDDVLSVLTAAQLFEGAPPPQLRAEAAAALRALSGQPAASPADPAEAVAHLRARIERIAPAARVVVDADTLPAPADPLDAVADAAIEAVRNAVRHAHAGQISVHVAIADRAISATVADDGIGFDLDAVPPERLGVRDSIVARMRDAGGQARIVSAPGAGTEVTLTWKP